MDVDIFQSITNRRKFVAVPVGLRLGAIPFPDDYLANLAGFKLRHRFDPDKSCKGSDAADIARQLERKGFAFFFEG